jgi:hypothetical protein
MAQSRTNSCDGTQGVTVTNANSLGPNQFTVVSLTGAGATCIYDNAHVHRGTTAIKNTLVASVACTSNQNYSGAGISPTPVANAFVRFYIYLTAYPTVATRICGMVGAAATRAALQVNVAGTIRTLNSAGAQAGITTAVIPLNQWCRIEWDVTLLTSTTCNQAARMFSGAGLESNTPDTGGSISNVGVTTTGTVDDIRFGHSSAVTMTTTWSTWFDDMAFSDTATPGPAGVQTAPVGYVSTSHHPGKSPGIGASSGRFIQTPVATNILSANTVATVGVVAGTTLIPIPVASADTQATPVVVNAGVTIPAPVVSTDETVPATVVNAATTIPVPGIPLAGPIALAVLGTTTIPAPTVTTGGTATASVVAAAVTIPTPTVTSSAQVISSVVSGLTSVYIPSVSTGETITVAVIPGITTVPTPTVSTPAALGPGIVSSQMHPGKGPTNFRFRQTPRANAVTPRDFLIVVADMQPGAAVNPPPSVVAALVVADKPDMVLLPGDLANDGTTAQYGFLNTMYGSIKSKLYPTPGNHDWTPGDLTQYDTYWGAQAHSPLHYYSFDSPTTGWHIIALESDALVAHDAASAQLTWLTADLAANAGKPMIAFWHHPRYSDGNSCGSVPCNGTGSTGDNRDVQPFWDVLHDAGCDIVFVGHAHSYQRFPKWEKGTATTVTPNPDTKGIRQFIVGSGGSGLHTGVPTRNEAGSPNSLQTGAYDQLNSQWFGYLRLWLTPTTYSWQFVSQNAGVLDSGGPVTINNTPVSDPSPGLTVGLTTIQVPVVTTGETAGAIVVAGATTIPTPLVVTSIQPAVVSATATAPTPVVATGETVTGVAVVAAVTAVRTPAITTSAGVTPQVVAVTTTLLTPALLTDETATAARVGNTTIIPTPAVSASGDVTVNPTVISASIAVPTPVMSTGETVTASVVAGQATITTPTVSIAVTVTPVVVGASATVSQPVVATGETVIATVVSATSTVPAVVVTTAPRPSVLVGVTIIPAPVVAAGTTASPARVLGTISVGTPTPSVGSVGASVTRGVVTIPVPGVNATMSIVIIAISEIVSIPVPGVNVYQSIGSARYATHGRRPLGKTTGAESRSIVSGREEITKTTGEVLGT